MRYMVHVWLNVPDGVSTVWLNVCQWAQCSPCLPWSCQQVVADWREFRVSELRSACWSMLCSLTQQ